MKKRSYLQNCSLALALDSLGERWTFLLIREMLTGPKRYKELVERLPAMGTNLLATRLKELVSQEILAKQGHLYHLTEKGKAIEKILFPLIRWNMMYNKTEAPENTLHIADWDKVAMKAMFKPNEQLPTFLSVELHLNEDRHYLEINNGNLVIDQPPQEPMLIIKGSQANLSNISHLSELQTSIENKQISVTGDVATAWLFLSSFQL